MVSTKSIVTLLIALVIAITLFQPVVSTVNTSTGTQTVTNESATADNETYVDLQGYDIDHETVYWNNTTGTYVEVTEGTDYDMNYSAGSIRALDSGSIEAGDDLKVSYDYQATDGTTATVAAIVPTLMALLMIGVMASKIQGAM
jgi:hypothetical protein